jgi:hypothetical protein
MKRGFSFECLGICAGAVFLIFLIALPVFAQPGTQGAGPGTSTPDADQQNTEQSGEPVQMTDIHDIKPPIKHGFNPVILYYALLGVVILALVGAALRYWNKRRIKEWDALTAPLSPDEAAHRLLDELRGARDITGKEFYFRLSAIFRGYIQGRFNMDALEMTTEEFVPRIDELGMDQDLRQQLKMLALFADPIKFAAEPASEDKMKTDLMFVRDLVKQTTPAETAGEEGFKDSMSQGVKRSSSP